MTSDQRAEWCVIREGSPRCLKMNLHSSRMDLSRVGILRSGHCPMKLVIWMSNQIHDSYSLKQDGALDFNAM